MSAKRIRLEECEEPKKTPKVWHDDDHIQLASLPVLVKKLSEKAEREPSNGMSAAAVSKRTILRAKDELGQIMNVQAALDAIVEKKKEELNTLFRSMSPLLSLEQGLLAYIVSYLDEEALLAFEEASKSFDCNNMIDTQWEYLDEVRSDLGKSRADNARERVVRFARASQFARRMEKAAQLHYGGLECDEWPDELYTKANCRADFIYTPSADGDATCEFFIRFSHRNQSDPLWEGFCPHSITTGRRDDDTGNDFYVGFDLEGVSGRMNGKGWGGRESTYWSEHVQQQCLENLLVTISVFNASSKVPEKLVVATGGYFGSQAEFAMLQPRSPAAHEQSVDLDDCVITGMRNDEFGPNIYLYVEWGDYDKF